MKRTWGLDVLECPRCAGRMELIAAIEDPSVARRILIHLGMPTRAPPRGRPWRRQLGVDDHVSTDGVDEPAFVE